MFGLCLVEVHCVGCDGVEECFDCGVVRLIDTGDDRQLVVMSEGVSLQELVDGLNALGVGPRDIIAILQTIKASGALQADLELM